MWQSVPAALLAHPASNRADGTVEQGRVLNLNFLTKWISVRRVPHNHTPNMQFIDKVQFKSYEDKTKLSRVKERWKDCARS